MNDLIHGTGTGIHVIKMAARTKVAPLSRILVWQMHDDDILRQNQEPILQSRLELQFMRMGNCENNNLFFPNK